MVAAVASNRTEHLPALCAILQATANAADVEDLFRTLYHELSQVLDTTIFLLGLYDDASQTITIVRQMHSGKELPGGSFPLGSGFTSQAILTRQPRLIRRWSDDGPPVQVQYATNQRGLPESGVTVPLLLGARATGVLSLQSYQPEAYDESDALMLQAIGSQVAVVIDRLRGAERVDAAFQRQITELETILASMADALLIVDAEGRIIRLNRAARQLLRPDSNDNGGIILGQPLDREQWAQWPLGAQATAEALAPMVEAIRRGEALEDVEVEVHGTGRRVLSFTAAPLRDALGLPQGGVVVFRDVTGRREVERLKDEVLSIASHDLKGPVAIIKMQAQLLLRRLANGRSTPAMLVGGLTSVEREADRLVSLLDLLLNFSRLEAGRLELHRQPMDLVALTRAVMESVQVMSAGHQLLLEAPTCVEGEWDARRLEQVLHNLLSNAMKYSPEGGTVHVAVQPDAHSVTVRVRDEGIGLPAEELPCIFERFYRAEGARRLEGSGLGLYICQGIITEHDGRIWAESEGLGRGSTFCFSVPRTMSCLDRAT
jgi:signal transduction histidine kinase